MWNSFFVLWIKYRWADEQQPWGREEGDPLKKEVPTNYLTLLLQRLKSLTNMAKLLSLEKKVNGILPGGICFNSFLRKQNHTYFKICKYPCKLHSRINLSPNNDSNKKNYSLLN